MQAVIRDRQDGGVNVTSILAGDAYDVAVREGIHKREDVSTSWQNLGAYTRNFERRAECDHSLFVPVVSRSARQNEQANGEHGSNEQTSGEDFQFVTFSLRLVTGCAECAAGSAVVEPDASGNADV